MRALALSSALLLVGMGPVSAQAGIGAPADVEEDVRAAVAGAWSVAPEAVVLDWGADEPDFENAVAVELVGSGSGGSWVARVTDARGDVMAARLRAGRRVRRPLAARRLARGTVLSSADVELQELVEWGPPNGAPPARMEGWVTQRILEKGDVLDEPAVRAPHAVSPGSTVALRVRTGSVRVDVVAVAAGAGAIGEEVDVRTESGRRVRGVIVGPGIVDVTRSASSYLNGRSR